MNLRTIKVRVYDIPLSQYLSKGFDIPDPNHTEEKFYSGDLQKDWLLQLLTRKQRKVARYLFLDDLTRKEIANEMGICLQAVHQIILRMRKRLKERAGIQWKKTKDEKLMKNLVLLYMLTQETVNPQQIYDRWYRHPVFQNYKRPELKYIRTWCFELINDLYG